MTLPQPDDRMRWYGLASPEAIFVALWSIVEQAPPNVRSAATTQDATDISSALAKDNARDASRTLVEAIEAAWPAPGDGHYEVSATGLMLTVMGQIDACFEGLHPRGVHLPPRLRIDNPAWVDVAGSRRAIGGAYHETDVARLIARGPFSRSAYGSDAASGDLLRGRFRNLAVARKTTRQEGRSINVELLRFSDEVATGVPRIPTPAAEKVAFIAVAEEGGDLDHAVLEKGEARFIDITPAKTLDGGARVLAAAQHLGKVDIALAPELTMGRTCASTVAEGLRAAKGNVPRLLLAGTALTEATGGLCHNEAVVMNANGHVLWRQRKIWPFGMQRERAEGFQLVKPGRPGLLFENIASSNTLIIADVDGLGRCVVLICQDLEATTAAEDILDEYQPDWVLVPILDPGVRIGGWAHARAFSLSARSQARFLIASSLTMWHWTVGLSGAHPAIGLAIGPKVPSEREDGNEAGDMSRAVALAHAGHIPGARCAMLRWRSGTGDWAQTGLQAIKRK